MNWQHRSRSYAILRDAANALKHAKTDENKNPVVSVSESFASIGPFQRNMVQQNAFQLKGCCGAYSRVLGDMAPLPGGREPMSRRSADARTGSEKPLHFPAAKSFWKQHNAQLTLRHQIASGLQAPSQGVHYAFLSLRRPRASGETTMHSAASVGPGRGRGCAHTSYWDKIL